MVGDAQRQAGVLNAPSVRAPNGAALLAGLADGSLPPAEFNHRAHVQAAWLCLCAADDPALAAEHFTTLLRRYVAGLGVEARYHQTLTMALLRLIDARRRAHPHDDWPAFSARFPELFGDARALLARHYSPECLAADAARQQFVAPDREPLP